MITQSIQEKATNMAKQQGFDIAKNLGNQGVYNVFVCELLSDKIMDIGMPLFILENLGELRFATPEETLSLLSMLSGDEKTD